MKEKKKIQVRDIIIGTGRPKICVPMVEKTAEGLKEAAEQVKAGSADLAEWRMDYFTEAADWKEIEAALGSLCPILGEMPLIVTFRTKGEGGEREVSEAYYIDLLRRIAETGKADFIDVEAFSCVEAENLIAEIQSKGVRVIASHHDFCKTPPKEQMLSWLQQMEKMGADMVKLAVMPLREEEAGYLMEVTKEASNRLSVPCITMSMGDLGVISRIAGEDYGSCITFGTVGKTSAPGQIAADDLRNRLLARKKNLFLIGFMGSGKSTAAEMLSQRLCSEWVEMDEVIARQEGMPISDLFEKKGETYFRERESLLLKECSGKSGVVVSCGGGAVLRPENVEIIKKNGCVILLTAEPKTVYERVKESRERPLLNENMSLDHIRELLTERMPVYRSAADITVATDGKLTSCICREIEEALFFYFKH